MGIQKKNNTVDQMFVISNRMKSQVAKQINFKERTVTFYTKLIRPILKSYDRSRFFGGIIILIQCIQMISLLYTSQVLESIQLEVEKDKKQSLQSTRAYKITQYTKYLRIYLLLQDVVKYSDDKNINNLCTAIFNLTILCFIFLRYLIWVFIEYQGSVSSYDNNNILNGSNYSTVNTMIEQRQNSAWKMSNLIISKIMQCYDHIFAIPFCDFAIKILYSSLNQFDFEIDEVTKGFGLTMFVTTLFLWLLNIFNDFDYSIKEKDALAQRHNYYKYFNFLLIIIFIGLRESTISGITLAYIYLFFSLFRLLVFYKEFPYLFTFAQNGLMLSNCFIFINSIVCVAAATFKQAEFSFLLLVSLPVSYKITQILVRKKEEELLPFMQGNIKVSDLNLANRYIRNLMNLTSLTYDEYVSQEKGQGISFETLYTSHTQHCSDESCFCSKYYRESTEQIQRGHRKISNAKLINNHNSNFFNGLSVTEMHGVEYRRQFVIDYLNNLFGKIFNFNSNSAFQFNYNQFQKEASISGHNGSQTNLGSTTGIRNLKSIGSLIGGNKKFSKEYFDQNSIQMRAVYVYFLMQVAQTPAKAFTQIFELREAMVKDQMSLQSKYIVQNLIFDTFDSFYHFFCMPDYQNQRLALTQLLEFDYLVKELKRSMLDGLQKKQNYFEYLYSDNINLMELVRQSEICIFQKEIVEQQLLRLFDICPTHPKSFIIADLYIEYFDFKKRRIRNFVTRSRKAMNNLLRKTDRRVDLLSLKSCALFISFRSSLITKATYTAANIFSCQQTDLLNKPFNMLIPDFLIKHTNKYLQALNEDGDMLWIQLGEYFSFIKNGKGYTTPVTIRSKLDIVDGNDFGLTLYIQPAPKKKEYIICDQFFQYLDSTKNITKILTKTIRNEIKSNQNVSGKNNSAQINLKSNLLSKQNKNLQFHQSQNLYKTNKNINISFPKNQNNLLSSFNYLQISFTKIFYLGLLKQINIRNLIPFLMAIDNYEEINDPKDFNEVLGFKDQQTRQMNNYTSILTIPTNTKQVSLLGQKVRLDAYEIDKYFCTYPSDELQFLEISFSVLRQKSYYEPEKYLYYIEIAQMRRFRKQAEINDYIVFLNERLTKIHQSPIQIPLLQKSTFYYRPLRPPTIMQQLDKLDSQPVQNDTLNSGGNESPKRANNPTNIFDKFLDSAHKQKYDNIDEGEGDFQQPLNKRNSQLAQQILQNQLYQDSNEHSPRQHNTTQQILGGFSFQDNNGYSPRQQNQQYITNFDSNQAISQYNQMFQTSQQIQTSQNNLFFSPRSEFQILNGNHNSETQFQNSLRELSMYNNHAREEDYLNQLLNQTQMHQINSSKIPQDVFSPVFNQQSVQQQFNETTDDRVAQNTTSNNYKHLDSFSMSNSLLSPELRRPAAKGTKIQYNNLSNIEDSYNQLSINIKNNGRHIDLNASTQRKLIKLQAPQNLQDRKSMKRNVNKNLTNVNVDEYEENDEEEEDEMRRQHYDNNVLSMKDVGSQNYVPGEFAFQNNNSEDSEDLKKKQRDIIRDDSSVRSGESQFYSKKVNIFDIIINKREPSEMIYIKLTGCISFIILMTLTFVLFLQLKTNFDIVWSNFTNLKIGPEALEQYSQVLRNYELTFTPFIVMCLTQIPLLPNAFRIALQAEGSTSLSQFQDTVSHIEKELFSQSQFQEYFYENEVNLMALTQANQDATTFIYFNTTRGQSFLYLPYYLRFYYLPSSKYLDPRNCIYYAQLNDVYSQAFTYQNYNPYIESLIKITTISQDNANEKLSSTKSLLIFSVILVEVISSMIVLVIFPVYYTIQGRKEEILKLICTFNSELISNQIHRYKQAQQNKLFIQDDVDKLLAIRRQHSQAGASSTNQNSMRFLPNTTEKKKRTISHTNNLSRFSIKLTFRTFCIFLILSLNPILNVLLMRGFFENFKYNIEEYSMIYQTKAYLSLNYLTTYLLINFPIYNFQSENRNKLYSFIDVLKQDGKERLQKFYEMDKNFQSERYQIEEYKSIFLSTLKENACKILVDNKGSSSFQFNQIVDPDSCKDILQGKIQKGIILAIREIYDKLYSLQDLFKATFQNQKIYIPGYIKWTLDNNLNDLDKGYYYLRDVIDLLGQFIDNSSKDYFDYLTRVQLILFIESLIVISIIFLVIGTRFIKNLGSTIYNTTFLFTLLPIDSLIENPYVFNYLNNEGRRNKGK